MRSRVCSGMTAQDMYAQSAPASAPRSLLRSEDPKRGEGSSSRAAREPYLRRRHLRAGTAILALSSKPANKYEWIPRTLPRLSRTKEGGSPVRSLASLVFFLAEACDCSAPAKPAWTSGQGGLSHRLHLIHIQSRSRGPRSQPGRAAATLRCRSILALRRATSFSLSSCGSLPPVAA